MPSIPNNGVQRRQRFIASTLRGREARRYVYACGLGETPADAFAGFEQVFADRIREADEFYAAVHAGLANEDARQVQRQALAGMLWNRQCYHYNIFDWLQGDPGQPPPPPQRQKGRNHDWAHLNGDEVLSMPDKWEYPWFAAWDLGFHCIALSLVDPEFAKRQLVLAGPRVVHASQRSAAGL